MTRSESNGEYEDRIENSQNRERIGHQAFSMDRKEFPEAGELDGLQLCTIEESVASNRTKPVRLTI